MNYFKIFRGFFAALWLSGALAVFAATPVTREPYLQEMTSHSVRIAWRTASAAQSTIVVTSVNAQHPESPQTVIEKSPARHHAIFIQHLVPNTEYQYQIREGSESVTDWLSFKTFPDKNQPFSFAVLGDSGTASTAQKEIAAQILSSHPNLIIHTGDVIYDGKSDQDFDSKFFAIYAPILEHVPVFPSLGNHDSAWHNGDPYFDNFYVPQNSPGQGEYYSFDCGEAHFMALDSDDRLQPGSPQYQWLMKDLKNSHAPLKIVYFHYPLYSSGWHGSFIRLRRILAPVFERYHVLLVFNGHDHDYERSIPIHGITYIVTGGGGAMLSPPRGESPTAYFADVHHFVLGAVNGRHVHLDAIDTSGKIFDQADIPIRR